MPPSVLVAVCTYKRPDYLIALLDSLIPALAGSGADLLVVDNDSERSAEELVGTHPVAARYVVCPEPGIAQARNAALELRSDYDFIAFIDDDETVDADWLTELVAEANELSADVATGPVVSIFPPETPKWILRGGFVQRPRHPTGTVVQFAATNNVLIRNAALDELAEPWFDVSYSRSGGSDAELTGRLGRNGASIIWIDTAVVREVMPLDRLTFRWIMRRIIRGGNVEARMLARHMTRAQILRHGLRGTVLGMLLVVRSLVFGRGFQATEVGMFAHSVGVLRAALGSNVYEYARG